MDYLPESAQTFLKSIPIHMDFDGQKRAEKYFQRITVFFAVLGLIVGFSLERLSYAITILAIGFAISAVLTLPPWPIYRRKSLKWLKPKKEDEVEPGPNKSKKKK